jgi:hypothetical protein
VVSSCLSFIVGLTVIDSIKTLRFLHQLLLVVAGAALILGFTPDPSHAYNAALEELIALKKIEPQIRNYVPFLRLDVAAPEDDSRRFEDLVRASGAVVPEHIEFPRPFASDYAFRGSRLMDYDAFFMGVHEVASIEFEYDKTRTTLFVSLGGVGSFA